MKAILLVGGLGTRLRPLTDNRPKALIPLLNQPFIAYLLEVLKEGGVTEVVFAAGHLSKELRRIVPAHTGKNLKFNFAEEPQPLGTGGAIRFAFERFKRKNDSGPVLVFNGDVLFDLNLHEFLDFHRAKKAACTIALKKMPDPTAFGVVDIDSAGRIKTFVEKPHSYREPSLINAGVYAITPALIRKIPLGKPSSVERNVFPGFLAQNLPMYGYVSTGYWNDIGTPKSYAEAHRDLLTNKNSWTEKYIFRKRAHRTTDESTVVFGDKTTVAKSAQLNGMVCCGSGVKIGPGAEIEDSILFDRVRVGKDAKIFNAIIGTGSVIDSGAMVPAGMVLGDKSHVKRRIHK